MANPPKDAGTRWERRVVTHAQEAGLPWDRAPLRGSADLLDVTGCQAQGLLVGCKAISRTGSLADKLGASMVQGQRAKANWAAMRGEVLTPVQVLQRSGKPVGQAYVVLELDDFLRMVKRDG